MTPVRAVLLDLGNVLVFHDNARLFRELGARAGLSGPEVQARVYGPEWDQANRGHLGEEALRAFVNRALGLALSQQEFFALFNCHFTVHHAVLPRVEALLGQVKVGLLSNTNWVHWAYLQPHLPLLRRFDALTLSCETGWVKPEGPLYRLAVRRLGVGPSECVFFDDLPEYVEAARAEGLRARVFTDAAAFDRELAALGP